MSHITKTTLTLHVIERKKEEHHLINENLLKNQYHAHKALYSKNLFSTTKPQHETRPLNRDHNRNPGMR